VRSRLGLAALLVCVAVGLVGGCQDPQVAGSSGGDESLSIAEPWTGPTPKAPALFPVRQDNKWGFIDKTGQVVIDFQYDDALEFSGGLAAVKLDGKWGYVDESGARVVAPQPWHSAGEFSDGLAPVKTVNPLALTETAVITTYIDETGIEVIPADPTWSDGSSFSEGLAAFYLQGSGTGFINTDAKVVIQLPDAVVAGRFSEGLAAVEDAPYRCGYIDRSGGFVIEPQYQYATEFNHGLAVVEDDDGHFLIIDVAGMVVAKLPYEQVLGLKDGLAPARVWHGDWPIGEGSWGYIDETGRLVIPAQFRYAYEFSGGLAQVWDENEKMSYIDLDGNYVWREE
jgi:hypothetical protein